MLSTLEMVYRLEKTEETLVDTYGMSEQELLDFKEALEDLVEEPGYDKMKKMCSILRAVNGMLVKHAVRAQRVTTEAHRRNLKRFGRID